MPMTRNQIEGLIERNELTTRTYQVRMETLDEKARSIEAVIATENRVLVMDWGRWEIIEEILLMSGFRAPANGQVPLLDTHDRSTVQKQHGSTRNLRVEGDKLIGRNFFSSSKDTEHAWTLTKEGHLTDNSAGYRVINSVIIPKGEKANVGGKEYQASAARDLRITTEWILGESSICPIGADEDAKNRSKSKIFKGEKTMDEFTKWLIARGENPDTLDEQKRAELEEQWQAEQKRDKADPPAKEPDNKKPPEPAQRTAVQPTQLNASQQDETPEQVAQRVLKEERERVDAIRNLGGDDVPAEVIERCIKDGKSVAEASTEILKAVRESRADVSAGLPAIHIHNKDVTRGILVDGMLLRAGYEDEFQNDKKNGDQRAEKAKHLQDNSLIDICRHAIVLDGGTIPTSRRETIRAAFSTVSLPIALGEVINKSLMKGYLSPADTWQLWCSIANASDFKTMTRNRVTDIGDWEQIGAAGELKHGTFGEEYEQYKIATYGKLIIIERQTIINDDLNALTKVPFHAGRRSRLLIAKLIYTHLMTNGAMQDGVALFHADHGNLNGTNSLTSEHLGVAKAAMRKQKDKDNQPIDLEPTVLLIPPELEQTGKELLESDYIIRAGSTDTTRGSKNVHKGTLEVGVESRLSSTAYPNYSATTWFLMASPNDADNVEVAFLNGKRTPTIERVTLQPGVLGIGWQGYIDVGCKALDHRGVQKNTA